jgi:hypothetical protein
VGRIIEKFNKVYLLLWLLLSTAALFIALALLLDPLTEIYDNVAIWFFFLFFCSEIIGFVLSSLIVDHIPNAGHSILIQSVLLFASDPQ